MEIVFKTPDFVVVNKPAFIPSQKDRSADVDAMSLTSELLVSLGESGSLWLIHRLDRVVGGLLIFARSKESAAILSRLVAGGSLGKHYMAVAEGRAEGGVLKDLIFKDSTTSKAYITDRKRAGAREAELRYSLLAYDEARDLSLVDIELVTGRFHQIRAQFSSRKMPLVGDRKYGAKSSAAKSPALFAYGLDFEYKGERYELRIRPEPTVFPWSLFDINQFFGDEL